MSEQNEELIEEMPESGEDETPDNFIIDILTGETQSPSPKNLLIQRVLRQLIESYGFDRADLEVGYKPRIPGHGRKSIDVAIFRHETDHSNDNLQRIIICKTQKRRDKLRSHTDAEADLQPLRELIELLPSISLGMWTNGQEEFLVQVERTRFEVRTKPLGVWPVPGENTSDLDKTGGVIQVSAEAEDLEDALLRCKQFLNRNLGLDHKDAFKQLAVLVLAKINDETQSQRGRRFWIKGDEPFTEEGQKAIQKRISDCISDAKQWQPNLLARGWDLTLEPHETARVVMELARYNLSETQPRYRTNAFRAIARNVMDGREGRYPTPLNVAEMAVKMLDPRPTDRVMDCSCGTGTFLAMAATHIFNQYLSNARTTPESATPEQIFEAQSKAAEWVNSKVLGCEIDPYLTVTSRMNLLFTVGDPGRVFRLDARTFPEGDLDGVEVAQTAIPLESMDMVLLNPWFSTKDVITDDAILREYDLGKVWNKEEGGDGYINTGDINTAGVPPEILFIEKALKWVKPGIGRVAILLPDGVLGNPGDEYVRWWILRHCEILASVDLPVEPFKATLKDYGLKSALPSLLLLRRRDTKELINTEYSDYKVFMAVVDKAGVDSRGKLLFNRAPDGEELIFDEEVVERIRFGDEIQTRKITRRNRKIHDELPIVADKYKEFIETGEVSK